MRTRLLFATLLVFMPSLALGQAIPAPPDADTLQARINVYQAERDQLEQNLASLLVQLNKAGKDLTACQAKLPTAAPSTMPAQPDTQ